MEPKDAQRAGGRTQRSPLVAGALSAVLPGTGQLYAGRSRRGWTLLAITLGLFILGVFWLATDPVAMVKLAFRPAVLRGLLVVNGAVLLWRVWAGYDAYRGAMWDRRPPKGWRSVVGAVTVAAVLLVPHVAFAYYDLVQLDLITTVFGAPPTTTTTAPPVTTRSIPSATTAEISTAGPTTTETTTAPVTTSPPRSIWEGTGRVNILLLGSDAGVDRTGVRTDTMVLVSVDRPTGDVALFSIPRNFARVPLPPEIDVWACDCFPPILNELYDYGERNPDVFAGTAAPGANAIKAGVSELLGLPVQFYALIALDGFVEMVDALGGVTVTVTEPVYDPAYPREDGGTEVIDLQPGVFHFDGHDALAFARSRFASDDYSRMGRQRCVLEALVAQADPLSLLRGFPQIADVLKRSLETDIPIDSVPDLIELAASVDTKRAISIPLIPPTYISGLTPEGYNIPNVDLIRDHAEIATTFPPAQAMAMLGIDPLADACAG